MLVGTCQGQAPKHGKALANPTEHRTLIQSRLVTASKGGTQNRILFVECQLTEATMAAVNKHWETVLDLCLIIIKAYRFLLLFNVIHMLCVSITKWGLWFSAISMPQHGPTKMIFRQKILLTVDSHSVPKCWLSRAFARQLATRTNQNRPRCGKKVCQKQLHGLLLLYFLAPKWIEMNRFVGFFMKVNK